VVGYFHYTAGWDRPFLWTKERGLIELPLPPDSYEASCGDINEAGQIVGTMTHNKLGWRGFIYENGQYTILPPVIPDAGCSGASAINNDGTVVGYRSISDGGNPYNAYLWSAEDGFTDLAVMVGPYSSALDVSDVGVIVGWTGSVSPGDEGFLWKNGDVVILGPIPGGVSSTPRAVNAREQVVGSGAFEVAKGRVLSAEAFIWERGLWTMMGQVPGYDYSTGHDINDVGQAVGRAGRLDDPADRVAFLWQHASLHDLNDLALLDRGFTIRRASAINNAGQILGDGSDPEWNNVTFLLTPIDRPDGDITGDCEVGAADLLFLLGEWGKTDSLADINGDGIVNAADLLILLGDWGS
jgi:probable HAF family extracellular repeat protein